MVSKKRNISIRVRFHFLIENLSSISTNISSSLLSRIPIRQIFIVSSLTGLSDNVSGRSKVSRNRSLLEKIKDLLEDYGSSTQQLITINHF